MKTKGPGRSGQCGKVGKSVPECCVYWDIAYLGVCSCLSVSFVLATATAHHRGCEGQHEPYPEASFDVHCFVFVVMQK